MIKKIVFTLLTLFLFTLTTNANCGNFKDISSWSWQEKYTNIALQKWISNWYAGCLFKPSSDITYVEALSIIFKTLWVNKIWNSTWESNTVKTYLTLLSSSNEWLEIKRKIVANYNDKIKRQEVLFLFTKFIELQNSWKVVNLRVKDFSSQSLYSDVSTTSDYYNYVYIFNKSWVITDSKNFYPNNNITRIEFLKMLINTFYDNSKKDLVVQNINNIKNTEKIKVTLKDTLLWEWNFLKGEYEMSKDDYNNFERKYIVLSLRDYFDKNVVNFIDKNYNKVDDFLMAYDYINNTKLYEEFISNKEKFVDILTVLKWKWELLGYKETIDKFYSTYTGNWNIKYLPSAFNDEWFQFMLKWFTDDKKETIRTITAQIGLEDSDLVLAWILTEQTRYAFTNRGYVKEFMKGVPILFSMTQFSYWVGWIKEQTGLQIEKEANKYWYWPLVLKYDSKTTIKQRLTDSYYEYVYPALLIQNILTRWNNAWYDISNKIWVIWTLYNFGNDASKVPHWNPQVWWAVINIDWTNYSFWGLYNSLYWYLKLTK